MLCNSVKYRCASSVALFVILWIATPAIAQDNPQMREVVNRLDRLEMENRALTEEIRVLRQQVGMLRTPAETVAVSSVSADGDGQQGEEERQAVQQSRIEEIAQTKVEASQKFPIRISGTVLFNAYRNGRHNNETNDPTIASLADADATGGGTLRQTTLGLLFNGPDSARRGESQRIRVHGLLRWVHHFAESNGPPPNGSAQRGLA